MTFIMRGNSLNKGETFNQRNIYLKEVFKKGNLIGHLCCLLIMFLYQSSKQDLSWMEPLYSTGQRLGKVAESMAGDLNIIQFLPKPTDSTFPLNVSFILYTTIKSLLYHSFIAFFAFFCFFPRFYYEW